MRRVAILSFLMLAALAAGPAAAATCNGAHALCKRHFDHVVLPATHNSMSAAADGFQIPNQPVGIPAQLRDGIRGFLIDAHYGRRQPDGTVVTDDDGKATGGPRRLYLCHVACQIGATKLTPTLAQIRRFVERHPRNVLLLDVEDYVTPRDFARAVRRSGLIDHVYRGSVRRWPRLREMIRTRQQVVVLAEHHAGVGDWYHLAYLNALQETPYTWDPATLITDPANWPASCVPNRGPATARLFLMNHWSPPTPRPQPDPVADAQVNAKDVLVGRARACEQARGRLPTLVAVDGYRSGDLLGGVRELNGVA